jgi:hypothetical protein
MVIRKSNIAKVTSLRTTPIFHALAWMEFPYNRRLAFVTLVHDQEDVKQFIQHDVIIDGVSHFCVDVRTFGPRPHLKGDSIGILVESA